MEVNIKYLFLSFVFLLAFALGTTYGFKQGYENYALLEAVLASSIDSAYAEKARDPTQENIDSVLSYLEYYVDHGIDSFMLFENNGNKILSNIFLKQHIELLQKSGERLASYRNKWPEEKLPNEGWEPEMYSDYEKRFENRKNIIARIQASP